METLVSVLPYIQVVLSVILVTGILLQQSAAGMGGAFGDNFSSAFHTRRGVEKFLFNFTLVISTLFLASALLSMLVGHGA
jgi:preprotein translocase subunit SecG